MSITKDRVPRRNHTADDLGRIESARRFSQHRNQRRVEVRTYPIADDIKQGERIANKVPTAD
jgi:hypothetical protein